MLIKAGVPLKKTRNRIEAERRLTSRPRGLAILHPLTLNCSSFLIASSQYNDTSAIIHSGHDDVARRLYASFRGNIVINSSVVIFTRVRFLNIIAKINENLDV